MSNIVLKPIYKRIYNDDFSSDVFEKRMKMQKAIYLLQEMGIMVGNYDFFWYKHGPYCQTLQDDILDLNCDDVLVNFSEDALIAITKLHDVLNEDVAYEQSNWAECLASIQYLRSCIFPFYASDDDIVRELQNRKPHLDNYELNLHAVQALKTLV
ncbi:MAG: hypothetical protein HFJ98_00590 [Eubacterium sp.]|nr:hypothetical protein [Eubacterium sp.]